MDAITLTQPDDWHTHLRNGDYLATTVPATARQFGRAIVMPNLVPPVTTLEQVTAYKDRISAQLTTDTDFTPLMTLYLTDDLNPAIIQQGHEQGLVTACKLYPAGATTNSAAGVIDIKHIYPVLETMANCGMPLLVHGEVTREDIDIFDREACFIDEILLPLTATFPQLKIVLEHITTQQAVEFVMQAPDTIAATITPHHLLLNRNDLLVGGIKPHYYCLPILKSQQHQQAIIAAAISGDPKFFLGTDSAPHAVPKKEKACGCAGIYSAHAAIELYATAFEQHQALDKLEAFASFYGADFYGLPRNTQQITLRRQSWDVPTELSFGQETLKPFWAGQSLQWQLTHDR